jgi:hypothetical protein
MPTIDLKKFNKRVFSQFGQDGVLEELFSLIPPVNKYFVEFGSHANDEGMGNTANLRRHGFNGLLINDTDRPYGRDILNKIYDLKIECITAENINEVFKKYNVPEKFDFLSIDIDGNDYWVWKSLSELYRPQVVCIETNCYIPIDRCIVQEYDISLVWKGDCRYGCSCKAMYNLALSKGYSLVAYCVSDMIFVRNNRLPKGIDFKDMNNLEAICTVNDLIKNFYAGGVAEVNSFNRWVEV